MEPINFWKLCDDYSIMHAALIAVGYAPDDVEGLSDPEIEKRFPGYIAVRTALCGAIEGADSAMCARCVTQTITKTDL